MVTHRSTNPAQHWVTSLTCAMPLSLSQTPNSPMLERILEDRSRHQRVGLGYNCRSRPAMRAQLEESISPHWLTDCSAVGCRAAAGSTAISLPSLWAQHNHFSHTTHQRLSSVSVHFLSTIKSRHSHTHIFCLWKCQCNLIYYNLKKVELIMHSTKNHPTSENCNYILTL